MASLKDIFKERELPMTDMFDIRRDIEKALTRAGFEVTGAGTCDGAADISVVRDGHAFWIDIKHLQ